MPGSPNLRPDVRCSILLADSRLDDELSVATIEFSGTPIWLQRQNQDPFGFPKKTTLGTLWRGVDTSAIDEHGQSAFIRAVIDGGLNLHFAEMLAEFAETDVNIQDEHGRTALHWACLEKLTDMVRLCLSVLECDVGLKDNDGLTAFDLALRAAGANEVIPTMFYRSMFEIEQSDPQTALLRALTVTSEPAQGRSPFPGEAIFAPVHDCNTPLVKALIERGVDLTARNAHGDTALHVAATKVGNVEIAAMLLEAGSDVNAVGNGGATPLHHAAQTTESQTMVELFLNWDADTAVRDIDDSFASDWASQTGQLDIARIIEDHDIRPRARETEKIGSLAEDRLKDDSAASEKAVPSVVPSEESLSVSEKALSQAVKDGDADAKQVPSIGWSEERELALVSVKQVPSVVSSEESPLATEEALFQAVKNGDADAVRRLLRNGVDIEAKNKDSQTALRIAAIAGHTAIVQILLSDRADIEAADNYGNTALHLTADHGHTEIVQALLAHGALIDAVNQWKWTALHKAAIYRHTEVVRILLAAGAHPGMTTQQKQTPLHVAALQGLTDIVNVLLEYKAPVNVVDEDGDTPWDDAAARRHLETMKALEAGGAKVQVIAKANIKLRNWGRALF